VLTALADVTDEAAEASAAQITALASWGHFHDVRHVRFGERLTFRLEVCGIGRAGAST
jgi:hypothetical protein